MRRTRGWPVLVALAWGLGAWAASGPTTPPDESWLKIHKPGRPEKPPVHFSHRRHSQAGIACDRCHHDYQGGRNRWREGLPVDKCQGCHKLFPQAGRLDVKNAFHRQCKGCHLARRKARHAAGPVTCEGCHGRR